jgi:mono/diheme cytochrome c family protein
MRKSLWALPLALLVFSATGRAADDASALYKEKCTACHGPDGTGKTPAGKAMKAPDFTSPEMKKETDDQFADAIQKGKGKMPAIKTLNAVQVKQLVDYCRHFGKS